MTKSGFCGIKLSLQFNFLFFNASWKEMGKKQDQGRLHVARGGEECATRRVGLSLPYRLLCQVLAFYSVNVPGFTVLSHSWGACGCRSVGEPGGKAAFSPLAWNYPFRSPGHPAHAGRDAPRCQRPGNPPARWWSFEGGP